MLNPFFPDDSRGKQIVIFAFPLVFYTLFFNIIPTGLNEAITQYSVRIFYATLIFCTYYTLILGLMSFFLYWQNSSAFFKVNLKGNDVLCVILLVLANLFLSTIFTFYLPLPLNQELLNENQMMVSKDVLLVRFYWGGIVTLINEELFYRGILMSTYFKHSRYYLDVLVSAICFASAHVIWSAWSWLDFIQYIPAGLSLGLTFKWTKSIYYPILLHFLVNYGPRIVDILLN
ncbi:CPBP family intramembrane glutamic endopeptidase [Streptococcus sp. H31]|uniref:CPBP family intramembrane glutamic endopeptidase n=1 Tax=Streptococcus huangxiaojuni TaxID=3237239 RepID=UPI0034A1C9F2